MKFKLDRMLFDGKYYVKISLAEFTSEEQQKAAKFGYPRLQVRTQHGISTLVAINQLSNIPLFPFSSQIDAEHYVKSLERQIQSLKNQWAQLHDSWSGQEVL